MPKLVMMPPQRAQTVRWASQLMAELPAYLVALPETDEEAKIELRDADAAFGYVPPDALADAAKLAWLQSPACN